MRNSIRKKSSQKASFISGSFSERISDYHMNLLEVRESGKYRFKNKEVDEVFRTSRHIFAGEYDRIKKIIKTRQVQ